MKKQLLLTALIASTAFSVQASMISAFVKTGSQVTATLVTGYTIGEIAQYKELLKAKYRTTEGSIDPVKARKYNKSLVEPCITGAEVALSTGLTLSLTGSLLNLSECFGEKSRIIKTTGRIVSGLSTSSFLLAGVAAGMACHSFKRS